MPGVVRSSINTNENVRIKILLWVFVFLTCVIVFKLFYIQVYSHERYKALALNQHWSKQQLKAKRGNILSKDGHVLATSQTSYRLYIEPKKIQNAGELSDVLATQLTKDISDDVKRANRYSYYLNYIKEGAQKDLYWYSIARYLTPQEKNELLKLDLVGVGFDPEPVRFYPEVSLASHLLGFVASDKEGNDIGYYGIEGYFNGDLAGKSGSVQEERDVSGTPILIGGHVSIPPINGSDIITTIDRSLQYMVEQKLEASVKATKSKTGTVIIMNPTTGDILAMANYPTFNPGFFTADKIEESLDKKDILSDVNLENTGSEELPKYAEQRANLAITQTYEPGSVIKPLTLATALDLDIISTTSTFTDSGPVEYSGYYIDNWNKQHHGLQDMTQLLEKSNNIGAAWVGHQVGASNMSTYLQNFGYGKRTGVELEGEDSGVIHESKNWVDIDLANISFGQGFSATALQVLNSFNAFANKGVIMKPRIVSAIVSDNKLIELEPKVYATPIKPDTAKKVTQLMQNALKLAELELKGYSIAGKTGTAQISYEGSYSDDKTNVTFVGYIPEAGNFTMIAKLEEPKTATLANQTVVPLWLDIAQELVSYYPDKF
ncbi:MAG: penicillin-binding protein 2 [Patescibacteria group bacterium]